jgi:hypothetical protein
MSWDNDYDVLVKHDGIKLDRGDLGAVLFFLESADEDEEGATWVPRSLLTKYDNSELWIPKWKAEQLECDYE